MWDKIRASFQKKYRIQFIDNESLSQSRSLVVRPTLLYILLGFAVALVVAGSVSAVFFTPIKQLVPGYVDEDEMKERLAAQQAKIDTLQSRAQEHEIVLASLNRIHGAGIDNQNIGMDEVIAEANAINANYDYPPEAFQDEAPEEGGNVSASETPPREFPGTRKFPQLSHLLPPVQGVPSRRFLSSEKHFGVDIVADENSLIKSVDDGFVVFSEYSTQTGYVIGIAHPNNLISFYKHNSLVYKKVGSYVFAGEAIAVIGNSGENSTGPHLHFELWHQGQPVNPEEYITLK